MKKMLFSFLLLSGSFLVGQEVENTSENAVIEPIIQVTQANLDAVLKDSKLVILDIYTEWCPPCKMLSKVIKEMNLEFGDVYQFAKLDAEKEHDLAKRFQVRAFPTIIFFKDGKEIARRLGYMNKEKFIAEIATVIASN